MEMLLQVCVMITGDYSAISQPIITILTSLGLKLIQL